MPESKKHLEKLNVAKEQSTVGKELRQNVIAFGVGNLKVFTDFLPETESAYQHISFSDVKVKHNVYFALKRCAEEPVQKIFLGSEGCTFTQEEWDTACKKYNKHIEGHYTAKEIQTIDENLKAMTESVFKWIQMVQSQDCKASTKSGSSTEKDSTLGDSYEPTSAADTGSNNTQ
jgi:hypothetical protein